MVFEIFVIIAFSFLVRLPFTIMESSDHNSSFIRLDMLRSGYMTMNFRNSLLKGFNGYPSLSYYFVSLFPEKLWGIAGLWLTIFYDIASILLIYAIATQLHFNQTFTNYHVFTPAFYAAILFSTTPSLFGIKARLKSFSGRTFGLLFSILFFVFIAISLIENKYAFYLLAGIPVILIIMSSQFGLQNICFVSLCLSFVYLTPLPLLAIVIFVTVGYFIPPLKIKEFVLFKIEHYIFYLHFREKGTTATGYSLLGRLSNIKLFSLSGIKSTIVYIIKNYYRIGTLILILENPIVVVFFVLLAKQGIVVPNQSPNYIYLYYALVLIFSAFLIFIITSFGFFKIFGQPERYLEYASPWFALVLICFCNYLPYSEKLIISLLIINIALISFFLFIAPRQQIKEKYFLEIPENENMLSFLRDSVHNRRIIVLPLHKSLEIGYFAISMKTNHKFFYKNINIPGVPGARLYIEALCMSDWPRKDLVTLLDEQSIDLIILDKKLYTLKLKEMLDYDFSAFEMVYEDTHFKIYSYTKIQPELKKDSSEEIL